MVFTSRKTYLSKFYDQNDHFIAFLCDLGEILVISGEFVDQWRHISSQDTNIQRL